MTFAPSHSPHKAFLFLTAVGFVFLFAPSGGRTEAAAGKASLRLTAQRRAPARPAASAQGGQVGGFRFSANEIGFVAMNTGGGRFTLSGNASLTGQGRTINAQQISIDVPRNSQDISVGRANGNVHMTMNLESGRKLVSRGSSLVYRRDAGVINVIGGVLVRSDLEGGGRVDATGNAAEILTGPRTATLNGNVRLTLLKPDTIQGPAVFTGPSMRVDLRTGNWKMYGGNTEGNFNLKPRTGKS